jgi:hypothetical protein
MGQPRRPYNSNWLTEFTQQNKQKMDAQNVMALSLAGQAPSYPAQQQMPSAPEPQAQSYTMPDASLMSRYLKENNPASGLSNSPIASAGIQATSPQPMDYTPKNYMAVNAESPPQNDYTDFTDEGGETFKIKKQPKPAYDWSQDFG